MSQTFFGSARAPSQKFYCESDWHDDVTDAAPRGPITTEGRYQISVDGTDWPKTQKRVMRVNGGGGKVWVQMPNGTTALLPGHVCYECMDWLHRWLAPKENPDQSSLL